MSQMRAKIDHTEDKKGHIIRICYLDLATSCPLDIDSLYCVNRSAMILIKVIPGSLKGRAIDKIVNELGELLMVQYPAFILLIE